MSSSQDVRNQGTDATDGGVDVTVVEYEGTPDECVMWPAGADAETQVTTWIAAREGSFVPLSEMR